MGKIIGIVEGADIYLIAALLIFLSVFFITWMYLILMTKELVTELAKLPLETNINQEHEK